jgi:hypothetical protein
MMPAGRYFVGDLCYVMHDEWDEFCDITIDGTNCKDGEFQLKDGRKFAAYGTAYGDGSYIARMHGQAIGECGVDAGLIGCIRVEDIKDTTYDNLEELGVIVEFDEPFATSEEGGIIYIGHVAINTNWDDEEEDVDYSDVDEAQEWYDYDPDC